MKVIIIHGNPDEDLVKPTLYAFKIKYSEIWSYQQNNESLQQAATWKTQYYRYNIKNCQHKYVGEDFLSSDEIIRSA